MTGYVCCVYRRHVFRHKNVLSVISGEKGAVLPPPVDQTQSYEINFTRLKAKCVTQWDLHGSWSSRNLSQMLSQTWIWEIFTSWSPSFDRSWAVSWCPSIPRPAGGATVIGGSVWSSRVFGADGSYQVASTCSAWRRNTDKLSIAAAFRRRRT